MFTTILLGIIMAAGQKFVFDKGGKRHLKRATKAGFGTESAGADSPGRQCGRLADDAAKRCEKSGSQRKEAL